MRGTRHVIGTDQMVIHPDDSKRAVQNGISGVYQGVW